MSLDRTGQQAGLDRQDAACRQVAARLGLGELSVYRETVSASAERGPASEYARLLADARAGRVGAVLVWDIDRLTRRPREIEDWLDLAERGLRIVTVDGEVDTRNDNGRLFLRIKAAVARAEVERKSARQRAANDQRAQRGHPGAGGRRPFGYTPDRSGIVEAEAELLRQAYAEILAGGSLRSVVARWNRAGVPTALWRIPRPWFEWRPPELRKVLMNPRNAGLVRHRGELMPGVRGTWPAIVDEDTWRGACAILGAPERRTSPESGGTRRYLLTNLARCGICGAPMTTGANRRGQRSLKCSAARHLERLAEPIEDYVVDAVIVRLRRDDAAGVLAAQQHVDLTPLRARARALEEQREALAADVDLPLDALRIRDRALREQLAEIEAQLAEASRESVLGRFVGRDPEAVWASLEDDLDARRAVINSLMAVTVMPVGQGARVFREESVVLAPRRRS